MRIRDWSSDVCSSDLGRIGTTDEITAVVVATRDGVPVRLGDVAQVRIGQEIRTGSASENGREVVIGTALMLIGENSRTVAAAVDAELDEIRRSLPPDIMRSEEHTSELQSLMRISYAGF